MKLAKVMIAVGMVAMAQGVIAVETAYDFTVCSHGKRIALEANADIVSFGVEGWGVVASSTTAFWEKASTHCVGYIRITSGKLLGKGTCKWTEAGGDTAVGEWEYPNAGEPVWTWLAGTGKLKGISGGGTFRELFSAKPTDPTTSGGCRRDWGKYSLS